MANEEKQLLLKDLCERLPYGVIVSYQVGKNTPVNRVLTGKALDELMRGSYVDEWLKCSFKPYLRPMESMTEEEYKELKSISPYYGFAPYEYIGDWCPNYDMVDWLLSHHFDYRGLIEKGLALEAPEDMYNN